MTKAIALVCLLSLSMCLSQPAAPADTHASQSPATTPKPENKPQPTQTQTDAKSNLTQSAIPTHVEIITTSDAPKAHPSQASSVTDAKPVDNKTAPKANDTKSTEPPKNETKPDAKTTTVAPNESKAPGKDGKETSTEAAATTKTTEAPKAATEKPIVQARGFDGPSFIGGIILTLGLLAIGFMGFKYYKNQTERNYHTL